MTKFALTSDLHYGASGLPTRTILDKFIKRLEMDKDWDVLLIAGDLSITRPEQMAALFEMLREKITRPICVVRGNHDFWSHKPTRSIGVLLEKHKEYFEEHNIHYLGNNPYLCSDNVVVIGWDGWYTHGISARGTNDHNWMPMGSEQTLVLKSQLEEENAAKLVEQYKNQAIVLVNHMPIVMTAPSYRHRPTTIDWLWDSVKDKIKVYCYGHVHQAFEGVVDGVNVFSADVDYNAPDYLKFEVDGVSGEVRKC